MATSTASLAALYAAGLKHHGKGHGLYDAASPEELFPGMCGHVDGGGRWAPIVDLTQLRTLYNGGFDPVGAALLPTERESVWEELVSAGVERTAAGDGMATFARPAGGAEGAEAGAALLCNAPVQRRGLVEARPLVHWGRVNAHKVLAACPAVRETGFWLVAATYETADAWAGAWTGTQRAVAIAARATDRSVVRSAPPLSYSKPKQKGSWVHAAGKAKKNGEVEKKVIFFTGVHFKLTPTTPDESSKQRSSSSTSAQDPTSFTITDAADAAKPAREQRHYRVDVSVGDGAYDGDGDGAPLALSPPAPRGALWRAAAVFNSLPAMFLIAMAVATAALWLQGWRILELDEVAQ